MPVTLDRLAADGVFDPEVAVKELESMRICWASSTSPKGKPVSFGEAEAEAGGYRDFLRQFPAPMASEPKSVGCASVPE